MAFNIPTRKQIFDRNLADFADEIHELNPFIEESFIRGILAAIANREGDTYDSLAIAIEQLFPHTATGIYARYHGNLKGIDILAATAADGYITVTGVAGTIIPKGTQFKADGGAIYEVVDTDYSIATHTINISHLTSTNSIAHATTSGYHFFATKNVVTIAGATNPIYNKTVAIDVDGLASFNYPISSTQLPDESTSITATLTFASVKVRATTAGIDTNLAGGAKLTLTETLTDVDNDAYAQYDGISGGSDEETDTAYRARYLDVYRKIQSPFNAPNIESTLKKVAGITRVFIKKITPEIGDVEIYFVRDNDIDSIIPSAQEIERAKDAIRSILPVHDELLDNESVIVKAPIPKNIQFQIINLAPNTISMREAITNNLDDFFKTEVSIGAYTIPQDLYRAIIWQSLDLTTGLYPTAFTILNPVGDIEVLNGEIPIFEGASFG